MPSAQYADPDDDRLRLRRRELRPNAQAFGRSHEIEPRRSESPGLTGARIHDYPSAKNFRGQRR
jgi:hypothetical protein